MGVVLGGRLAVDHELGVARARVAPRAKRVVERRGRVEVEPGAGRALLALCLPGHGRHARPRGFQAADRGTRR